MDGRGETGPVAAAIVGMAVTFPGAGDLDGYWSNIAAGVDSISDVPPGRWDPVFYQPDDNRVDRFYCRRGGFVDGLATFDPAAHGVMPVSVGAAEPDQLVALQVAASALDDAGGPAAVADPERVAVILGRGGYLGAGLARLDQRVRTTEQIVQILRQLLPRTDEDELGQVREELLRQLGPWRPDDAIGIVPNLAASRIANRFDFHGPAYTVDAACASSLVAVDQAVQALSGGGCDLALAGGVHHCHDLTLWSVFSQLGAISRRGQIRPFDRDADGLLVGEGTGLVVLKRLADAERDGDRVYAVVRGVGLSSDGRGAALMSPGVEGQVLALRRAWSRAGLDPRTIGLLEAHGTATPSGDETELASLAQVFGPAAEGVARVPMGSVKSMIGHAMPAAGAAGLIKAALALHHRVLPPTLHCDRPHPALDATRFRPLAEAEGWAPGPVPRRAGVNAFGFGGVNAHVVLEEHRAEDRARARARHGNGTAHSAGAGREGIVLCAADDLEDLLDQLEDGARRPGHPPRPELVGSTASLRLAVVDPSPKRVAFARQVATRGAPWRGRLDVWFSPRRLLAGGAGLAFVFPGVEASFGARMDGVAARFGLEGLPPVDTADLGGHGLAVMALGRLLDGVLRTMGLRPDVVAGHSVGEWSGMVASGMVPPDQTAAHLATLDPARFVAPDLVFAAVGCGADAAASLVEGLPGVVVSHDNCPHQCILCGQPGPIAEILGRCRDRRIVAQELPFRSGFHTPMFAAHLAPLQASLALLPLQAPEVPLWSATTCQPYPEDPDAVRELAARHLVEPVRFRQLALSLHDHGVRAFVQVGVGSLVPFLDDTLKGREHLGVAAAAAGRDGLGQLRRVASALWTEGAPVSFERLAPETGGAGARPLATRARPLPLGAPLLSLDGMRLLGGGALGEGHTDEGGRGAPAEPAHVSPIAVSSQVRAVSVATCPWVSDHCLVRQRRGWAALADRFPVVPLTTMIAWLVDQAAGAAPGLTVVALEGVRARRWLAAAPPVEVTLSAAPAGPRRLRVAIEGYAGATAVLAGAPAAPPPPSPGGLAGEEPSHLSPAAFYEERWMFHGPQFQVVAGLEALGHDGVRGQLRARAAPGSLLDGAGQLVGYWVGARTSGDRIVLPTDVERIDLYGPEPGVGTLVDCTARITALDETSVRADLELAAGGRVWARVTGWTERRFETDDVLWDVLRFPEHHLASEPQPGGWVLSRARWRRTASRDLVMRQYLSGTERDRYESLPPGRRPLWLLGRLAAKDAVRHWLWSRDEGPVFPAEVEVANDPSGRPVVGGRWAGRVSLSLAHSGSLAVALAGEGQAPPVGIDVETVAARHERFGQLVLTPGEQALLGASTGPALQGDVGLARMWVAKEAAAKATGLGVGLGGNPRRFEVLEVAGAGASLRVGDRWVDTDMVHDGDGGGSVVGWTRPCG